MRKVLVLFAVLALMVIGLAAAAGAGSSDRPFKATFEGEVFWMPVPECESANPWGLQTLSEGTGRASHLGKTTMESGHCTPGPEDTLYGPGDMTFVAANGDELHITYGGECPLVGDLEIGETFSCTVDFDITGGTGRFDDAEGGGNGMVYVEFLGLGAPSMPASWVYSGEIGY